MGSSYSAIELRPRVRLKRAAADKSGELAYILPYPSARRKGEKRKSLSRGRRHSSSRNADMGCARHLNTAVYVWLLVIGPMAGLQPEKV